MCCFWNALKVCQRHHSGDTYHVSQSYPGERYHGVQPCVCLKTHQACSWSHSSSDILGTVDSYKNRLAVDCLDPGLITKHVPWSAWNWCLLADTVWFPAVIHSAYRVNNQNESNTKRAAMLEAVCRSHKRWSQMGVQPNLNQVRSLVFIELFPELFELYPYLLVSQDTWIGVNDTVHINLQWLLITISTGVFFSFHLGVSSST